MNIKKLVTIGVRAFTILRYQIGLGTTIMPAVNTLKVSNQAELIAALKKKVRVIEITRTFKVNHTITMPEKVMLKGNNVESRLLFEAGIDGIEVTTNNTISDLRIEVSPNFATQAGLCFKTVTARLCIKK